MALYSLRLNSATDAGVSWEKIRCKANEHFSSDCSIFLGSLIPADKCSACPMNGPQLKPPPLSTSSSSDPPHAQPRPLSLLSCGHLLHKVCIEALEIFTNTPSDVAGGDGVRPATHLCPLSHSIHKNSTRALISQHKGFNLIKQFYSFQC